MAAPNQHTLATVVLQGLSLGMLNFDSGKLIIKDPITGICNNFKQLKDQLMNNFNQGVWIGKRALKNSKLGFSSFLTQNYNLNYLHYVIRVDGQTWHLCDVTGSLSCQKYKSGTQTKIQVGRCQENLNQFEWFYKGKAKIQVRNAIQFINEKAAQYNIVLNNCQHVVKALYYYAREGFPGYDGYDVIILFLFPEKVSQKILKTFGGKTLWELRNMILP